MDDIKKEIEKLKYQINILTRTINSDEYPVESLILNFDWDDNDLNDAHDIFEEFDNKLEKKEEVSWSDFEHKLKKRFNIGYQSVKSIIISFYKNHQWMDVCYNYAKAYQCSEFNTLINDYEENIARQKRSELF